LLHTGGRLAVTAVGENAEYVRFSLARPGSTSRSGWILTGSRGQNSSVGTKPIEALRLVVDLHRVRGQRGQHFVRFKRQKIM
jgi:hypothetical protein